MLRIEDECDERQRSNIKWADRYVEISWNMYLIKITKKNI